MELSGRSWINICIQRQERLDPIVINRRVVIFVVSVLAGWAMGCGAAQPQTVTPGACRVKTDMELAAVYSIPTNFHSRTLLPDYRHVPGGITPATVRLEGGIGNVQLTPEWIAFVGRINGRSPAILSYLFKPDSGWQNSEQNGRVEELAFEDTFLNVLRVDAGRAYIQTYTVADAPPRVAMKADLRQQRFTVVTRDDTIIGAPPGEASIVLIARAGEQLWLPAEYLDCARRGR